MQERRNLPRYKAKLPVTFNDNFDAEIKFKGIIMDINLQGANIMTANQYTKGNLINMNINFKDGKKFFSILGEIKYLAKADDGYHLGVEITNYNAYHLKKLVDSINSLAITHKEIII